MATAMVKTGDRVRLIRTLYRDTDLRDLIASAGEEFEVTGQVGRILTLAGAFNEFEVDLSWVQPV